MATWDFAPLISEELNKLGVASITIAIQEYKEGDVINIFSNIKTAEQLEKLKIAWPEKLKEIKLDKPSKKK